MKIKTLRTTLPMLALLALAVLAPTQAQAGTTTVGAHTSTARGSLVGTTLRNHVWHNIFVIWSGGRQTVGSCRITFDDGIACAQNYSPYPHRFTTVNLKSTGKPYIRAHQKFPIPNLPDDARQLYPGQRSEWGRYGVHCKLNHKAGVRCSNGHWAFRLNPHSYKEFKL